MEKKSGEVQFNQILTAQVEKRMGELIVENINLRTQLELLKMQLGQAKPGVPVSDDELFEDKTDE